MKKLLYLLLAVSVSTLFYACDNDKGGGGSSTTVTAKTISAKWNVDGQNGYESFEFNESGNYIVVTSSGTKATDGEILFGTYQLNNNVITLSDFGVITVTDISSTSIDFVLKLNNSTVNKTISATKNAEVSGSAKTDYLCKTWELLTINGESVKGTNDELIVLFSRAGTYFVTYLNHNGENGENNNIGLWKWKDSNQNIMLYSWDYWKGESYYVTITELTSSRLVILEQFPGEDDEISVLQPWKK